MSLTVEWFDVTTAVIDYLETALAPVSTHSNVPNPRPTSFVRVERIPGGGRFDRVLEKVQLIVESWSNTDIDAEALGNAVRTAMGELAGTLQGGLTFSRVDEVTGMGNLPDPVSFQSRYTQTFELTTRGH